MRLSALRCAPIAGLWLLVREVCPAQAEEIDAVASRLFSHSQHPSGDPVSPPPLPAGAEAPRSARNPRSPLISLLIFAGGGVVNTTSVLQTACQEAKTSTTESGIRPRWGVLEFLNPFQL